MERIQIPYDNILVSSNKIFNYPTHMHTYYEMTLYQPFCGRISINGNDISVNESSAVMVCPSDFHEIIVTEETESKFLKVGFTANVLNGELPDFSIVLSGLGNDDFLVKIFDEILSSKDDIEYRKMLINLAVHILVNGGKQIHSAKKTKGHNIAITAAKMINEEFGEDITLQSVAKRISVAPQHLSAVFKQNLGMNFSEYLHNIRLVHAARLIENTEKNFTEICYESGFENFSHFSRSFKKKYSLSPREYRKSKQKE